MPDEAGGTKRCRSCPPIQQGSAVFAGFWFRRAFMQNLRRGHYELGIDARPGLTAAAAFDELAPVV